VAERTVSVKLSAEVSGYVAGLKQAGDATKSLGDETKKAKKSTDELANTSLRAGAVLAAGFALVAQRAAAFDKAMDGVHAATQAGAVDMKLLSDAALQAGKTTAYSAGAAADAEGELAKAGVSVRDILGGGLAGALNLAAAGQLDVGDAAGYAATAMTQFKLSGSDIPHVADLLAAAAGKAQGEVSDVGEALKQGGLVASQFGLSIEETTGALGAFASAGLIGSDAGTSLKTMLLSLANPTGEAGDLMKKLGINAYDAQGQFIGLTNFSGQLQKALGGMSDQQRNAALSIIFGSDAIRAANVLYSQGKQGIADWIKQVNDTGFAAQVAAQKTDNLAGDLMHLRGALDAAAIGAGGGINTGLRALAQTTTGVVNAIGSLPPAVTTTLTVFAGVSGAALLAAGGFLKVKSTINDTMEALSAMGARGEKAASVLGKVSSVLGKAGAWGAGALIAYEGVSLLVDYIHSKTGPAARDVDKLSDSLRVLATTGQATGEVAKVFGTDLGALHRDLELLSTAQKQIDDLRSGFRRYAGGRGAPASNIIDAEALSKNLAQAKVDIGALDESLAKIATSGGATQAKIAFQELAAATGLSLDQLPKYQAAASDAALANSGLAKGFGDAAANASTMAGSLQEATAAGQSFLDVFNQLNGGTLSFRDAQRQAEAAIDSAKAALDASSGSMSVHTEKGRAAAAAVDDVAKSAANAAQKKYEETGSLEAANAVYGVYIGQLRKTLSEAGLTKGQIDKLIGSIAKVPAYKSTTVEVKIKYTESGFGNSAYAQYFSGGKVQIKRWGGVTEHALSGVLRDADVYSAVTSGAARYAFAEPATGGEAFVPKRGDYGRSMSILQHAAGWYGASVVPGGWSGSGGGSAQEMTVRILVDGTGVLSGLREEITTRTGDPDRELRPVRRRP
jgi:TP901 family phage tail tape measure protein